MEMKGLGGRGWRGGVWRGLEKKDEIERKKEWGKSDKQKKWNGEKWVEGL